MRFLLAAGLGLLLAACGDPPVTPDAVFHNGSIHTGVDGAAVASAVSVKDGRILAVGASEDLLKTAGEDTRRIDLMEAHLYPGFTDAHVHLYGVGEREMTLDLDEVASLAELVETVKTAAAAAPEGQVLQGRGWIETHWPEKRFPTRADIDPITGDRPVVLTRADGHALLANTAALKAAGIDGAPASQPQGGRIEVGKDGLPTGMLIDNAMGLLAPLSTAPTDAHIEEAYTRASNRETKLGWTGGHNMSVSPSHVQKMIALSKAGKLKLRVYNAVDGDAAKDGFDKSVFVSSEDGLITTRAIKLYMDGALGSRGALLGAPYSDQPDTAGLQIAQEEETKTLLKRAYDEGIQVSFHAIGDRGNQLVLDWMEATFAPVPEAERKQRDPRWRVEHAQILNPTDIPRFALLGVIPSMQPSHAIGDLYFAPARLGETRLDGAYAWRSLIDAGSIIAGGSDAPVEQGEPLTEFYAAVARKDLQGRSGDDWRPNEKVTREEALKMFTLWPAYASFREKDLGTVEPGKIADFTVFEDDILTIDEREILNTRNRMTVINGEVVYDIANDPDV
jgi:predicted amidohydrolase YtcJ